jgi:hypothetical protein
MSASGREAARAPAPLTGGAAMTEDPIIIIIQMNIAHYGAMLKLGMGDEKRSFVERLLAEAKRDLALATVSKKRQ